MLVSNRVEWKKIHATNKTNFDKYFPICDLREVFRFSYGPILRARTPYSHTAGEKCCRCSVKHVCHTVGRRELWLCLTLQATGKRILDKERCGGGRTVHGEGKSRPAKGWGQRQLLPLHPDHARPPPELDSLTWASSILYPFKQEHKAKETHCCRL